MSIRHYSLSEIVFQPKPKTKNFKDLQGMKFSRLTALGYAGQKHHSNYWFCRCECGNITKVQSSSLAKFYIKSCGCLIKDSHQTPLSKLKSAYHSEYISYKSAKSRCENPNNPYYRCYGARGIKFCFKDFFEFLNCVGKKPDKTYTIDRINVNGDYSPENIRWSTPKQQARNTRVNHIVNYRGKNYTVTELAEYIGKPAHFLYSRIYAGFCLECAVNNGLRKSCPHNSLLRLEVQSGVQASYQT
jgi:hypothetical protein